jgi:hypothetical protein
MGGTLSPAHMEQLLRADGFVYALHSGNQHLLDLYVPKNEPSRAELTLDGLRVQEKEIVMELFDLMLRPLKGEWETLHNQENLKIAHLSYQTLASDLILDLIVDNPELLNALFYFLETVDRHGGAAPPSVYFSKILGSLFEHYPSKVRSPSLFEGGPYS